MSFEEKGAWIMGVVTIAAYTIYLVTVLGRADGLALVEVPYVKALMWSIGGSIIAMIALNILVAIVSPKGSDLRDERDKQIHRFAEYVGQSFVVIGGVAALVMALAEVEHFWIANAIYLAFVLSALLSSVTKLIAYRCGFQS